MNSCYNLCFADIASKFRASNITRALCLHASVKSVVATNADLFSEHWEVGVGYLGDGQHLCLVIQ